MRRVHWIPAAAMFVLLTVGAGAQARPDFSGRWTTDPDPAAPTTPAGAGRAGAPPAAPGQRGGQTGNMGSGWGSTITITQDASKLTVEYAFFGRGDMQPPLKFVFALDGTETRNSVMMGRGIQGQVSSATWQGDKLIIDTVHAFPDPDSAKPAAVHVEQVLSLESPTSLVVETTRNSALYGRSPTTRTVYRKLG
ncbi:MAG: hypothetical protein ACM4AI_14560 [Acidobacteriota bacterium]